MSSDTTKKTEQNLCRLADYLLKERSSILNNWKKRALKDDDLAILSSLTRREFLDHIPQVLTVLDAQLRSLGPEKDLERSKTRKMEAHGLSRWQQGFSITQVVRDWNHLRCSILEELGRATLEIHIEWGEDAFAEAVTTLANLIAEGINLSVAKYEEIRQSEAKSHAIDLEHTIEDLEKLAKLQRDQFQEANHDLAGHLGILASLSQVFSGKAEDTELEALHQQLSYGLSRSLQILEDVRYHSTLEAGRTRITPKTIDATEFIKSTLSPYLELAEKKSIELQSAGPKNLTVETDSPKLSRILQNLMHNALKFTAEGEISITWGPADDQLHWFVRFQNSGTIAPQTSAMPIGKQMVYASQSNPEQTKSARNSSIENEQKPLERNNDSEPEEEEEGDAAYFGLEARREGIGLSIAKRLANLLEGRLEVDTSSEDYGVIATVTLPVAFSSATETTD